MTSHTTLLKQLTQSKQGTCPECGAPNKCAMEQGKSIQACWCYGVEFKMIEVDESSECLCNVCLSKQDHFNVNVKEE